MSTATPADFRTIYESNLSDSEIQESLDYATDLNQEYNSETNQTTTQTKYIEIHGAAVNIRTNKERSVVSESGGGFSATYEANEIQSALADLRRWLDRAGGDEEMADHLSDVIRDTDRHVAQTHQS